MSVSIAGVDGFYGRSQILHGLSLTLAAGELTAVLGRNGVGKTTLLKALMGMLDRITGSIRLGAHEIAQAPTHVRARAGIAYVPQGRQIIPDFSIRENIVVGAFARRDGRRVIPELVADLFPALMERLDRPGGLLSGGQQQQLAIARALAAEPDVLLLDEPSEGIQPSVVDDIEAVIVRLNRDFGKTILLVEQNVAFVRRAAQRFAMMEKGRVVASGDVTELTDYLVHKHMAL